MPPAPMMPQRIERSSVIAAGTGAPVVAGSAHPRCLPFTGTELYSLEHEGAYRSAVPAVTVLRAKPATHSVYGLAEGPVWDGLRERVIWVDLNAGEVHFGKLRGDQINPGEFLTFADTVGAVVCSPTGELLIAGSDTLRTVAVDGTVSTHSQVLPAGKVSRLNDGACDPAGRFLVGSMALDDRERDEVLVRLESSGLLTTLDDDLTLSNGLAFTAAGNRLYSIDTTPGIVWVRDYDAGTGVFGPRAKFLTISNGSPDGLCIDADDNLWIAIFGAGQVRCFTPAGDQLATIEVAAPNVTSVAFVGHDLDILLITTASEELTASRLEQFPDSGRLFTCRVGVAGLPVPYWSGT
jgi:sugar lactone lactonase YvrE